MIATAGSIPGGAIVAVLGVAAWLMSFGPRWVARRHVYRHPPARSHCTLVPRPYDWSRGDEVAA